MNLELTLRGETRAFPLKHGLYRIGGHPTDDLKLSGLAQCIATARVDGGQVLVTAGTNLRVGSMVLAARTPHLLHFNEAPFEAPQGLVVRHQRVAVRRGGRLAGGSRLRHHLRAAALSPLKACQTAHPC
jgi:hypothetical protein